MRTPCTLPLDPPLILIANVANLARFVTLTFDSKHFSSFFRVFYLYTLYMIDDTIMGYTKHELSTCCTALKKLSYHTSTSP